VNGHSLLGVKLSEAQSYLIKSSEYVHMVICDGFNVPPPGVEPIPINKTEESLPVKNSLPFPRVPPPQPPTRQMIPVPPKKPELNGVNGVHKTNGHQDAIDFAKKQQQIITNNPPQQQNSNCNYDNLRNIDSDDSRLTSPEPSQAYLLNGSAALSNNNFNNKVKFISSNSPSVQNSVNQQVNSSLPLTDKNIMSNIMNKSNNIDIKSQSMMTNNTTTPVTVVT